MAVTTHERGHTPTRPKTHVGLSPVMVIDGQPLVRAGLVSLIDAHLGLGSVCFSGDTVREALAAAATYPGPCAVLGTRRDDPTGREVEAISTLAMRGIDVLVLVDEPSAPSLEAAIVAGAKGYLGKAASSDEFIHAVHRLASGRQCAQVMQLRHSQSGSPHVRLSDQERRALVLYASGLTQDVVARRMGIAPNTVKHYLDRVREKYANVGVHARTKIELHTLARAEGLLP